jgi:hypothetical protein
MPVWVLRVLHLLGLTNLSDREVERYARNRPMQGR